MQHVIISSVSELGDSSLKLLLAGCGVSFMEAGRRGLEVLSQHLHENFKGTMKTRAKVADF
jgi:hypothetical protein